MLPEAIGALAEISYAQSKVIYWSGVRKASAKYNWNNNSSYSHDKSNIFVFFRYILKRLS